MRLQDDIAQIGQGRIADRGVERLGRADVGVIAIRKLWARRARRSLRDGRALTPWRRDADDPAVGVGPRRGAAARRRGAGEAPAAIVDVRPHVEIDLQLRALNRATGAPLTR